MNLLLTVAKVWPGANGGAAFTGNDPAGKLHRVLASGKVLYRPPGIGETWAVQGEPEHSPKYGWQIKATQAVPAPPKGKLVTRFLAQNRAFQGVGEVRAAKLWTAFQDGLYAILDAGNRVSLIEVLGKGTERVVDSLLDAWAEQRAEAEIVRWLEEHGFPICLATKVMKLWGTEAPDKITDNPYRMLAVAGWERVDAAALDLGTDPEAEIRKIAAVEAVCYRAMAYKHTVIMEDELLRGIAGLLRQPLKAAQESLRLAEQDFAVVKVGEARWQALGPHVMESYIRERIAAMVAAERDSHGHLLWETPSDEAVNALVAEFQASNNLQLTDEQQQAVWLALTQRFGVIAGGAGTGKTTMLKAVYHAVEKGEGTVHSIALAGRAAIRMQEATGYSARTIAGFLGAHDRGKLQLGGGDLVIVDEASMVDLPLAYALFRAIPENSRVLLVGDPYQLPPIGMGVVFSAYCLDDRAPKVELTKVHRQAAEMGIPLMAGQIRKGVMPEWAPFSGPGKGISFVDCSEKDALGQIIEILGDLGGPGETQILGAVKRGPAGIQAVNEALHRLRATGKPSWKGYVPNDPVIWLQNDYERHIWNGTLGVVASVNDPALLVQWHGYETPMTITEDDLDTLDLAYAISVHKAQGSQFRRVIVPVFPNRLLDRTLIYTAITRATEQVVLVGDFVALRQAVEAPPASHLRNHGLSVAGTIRKT